MTEESLIIEKDGPVLTITLNRPDVRNALDRATISKGKELISRLHYDSDVRVVIITGNGPVFCAGADLKERKTMSPADTRTYVNMIRATFTEIENLPKPIICAFNGGAFGGGLELALACDIRVSEPDATFSLPETSLGIIPGGGGTQRLPRLVGRGRAKELIFTAKRIDAQTALTWGLINGISEKGKVLEEARVYADQILKCAPLAIEQAKFAINRGMDTDIGCGLEMEGKSYEITIDTADRLEALQAFSEKRPPVFKGE